MMRVEARATPFRRITGEPEMPRILSLLPFVATLILAGGAAVAQVGPPVGCYRADRPLGTSASATGGIPTPGLDTFRLLDDGRVERPDVGRPSGFTDAMEQAAQRSWARGSHWHTAGDTLYVRLSTGLSGWDLTLVPAPAGADAAYSGVARYLTDVVVADSAAWQPPRVTVRVTRGACTPPA
jgi:hypothetical protein